MPTLPYLRESLADLDWPARARVWEEGGIPRGIGLVTTRPATEGTIARVETAARDETTRRALLRWGLLLSRAAGAQVAQVWRARGHRQGLDGLDRSEGPGDLGLKLVRPFWRMDLSPLTAIARAPLPDGYRLASGVDWRSSVEVYNRAFAEHWRHAPLDLDRPPAAALELDLAALAPDGSVAGIVWCALERYEVDARPQPVGVVQVVGTTPEHRRRGLGSALVREALRRLLGRGARSASLYVDPLNPTHASDVYRRLGFQVGFEFDVYEISWRQPLRGFPHGPPSG